MLQFCMYTDGLPLLINAAYERHMLTLSLNNIQCPPWSSLLVSKRVSCARWGLRLEKTCKIMKLTCP